MLAELPTRAEREPVLVAGRGRRRHDGDRRGRRARHPRALRRARRDDRLRGGRRARRAGARRVVIDPIDGSLNAKRGIPFFSLSIAVADGDTMGDVEFALRLRLRLRRGVDGARAAKAPSSNGEPLGAQRPKDRIEMLAFEATLTSRGRRQGGGVHRHRAPPPDHGLARALALPPRRRPPRRRLLAEAVPLGRRRRRRSCSCASAGSSIANADGDARSLDAPLDLDAAFTHRRRGNRRRCVGR